MRYFEIVEARKNPERYSQTRGYQEIFEYLQQFSEDDLKNKIFIHQSATPKIGLNPTGQITMGGMEPLGIYTYSAYQYILDLKSESGPPYGHGFPYVTAITLKPNTRITDESVLEKLFSSGKKYTGAQITQYLKKLGYGCVISEAYKRKEYIILGTEFIKSTKQFTVTNLPKGATSGWDDSGYAWNVYPKKYLEKIKPYIDFIEEIPDLAMSPSYYDIGLYSPSQFSLLKLLKYAVENKKVLSRKQEAALAAYRDPEQENQFYDVYKNYVLEPLGAKSQLSNADLKRILAMRMTPS